MPAPNWSFFWLILHVPVNHNIRSSSFIFVTDIVHTFTTFKESYIDQHASYQAMLVLEQEKK